MTKPIGTAADSAKTTKKLSENDVAFIEAMLESEAEIMTAFTQAFGKEEAKKKLLEGWTKTLKSSDRLHLLDELKKRSKSLR